MFHNIREFTNRINLIKFVDIVKLYDIMKKSQDINTGSNSKMFIM